MKVFIDTSAFIALIFKSESFYKKATEYYKDCKKKRVQFITSDYILDELFTRCLYHGGLRGAKTTIGLISKMISHEELTVLSIDQSIFKQAQKLLLKFAEHKVSFTDATSYVLYKKFALDEIFTLDKDFKKIGAKTSF